MANGDGSGGTVGQTFTLTTGTDAGSAFVGTSNDDTFNGVVVGAGASGTTLQAGDNLKGGAGNDTLNVSISGDAGAAYSISGLQVSAIETVKISNFDQHAGVTTLDATLMSDVTTVSLFASSANGDLKVSNLQAIATAEMRNGSADLEMAYADSVVTGTADTQNLTVSNITDGAFVANGIETIAINAELVNSTLGSVSGIRRCPQNP